MAGAVLLAAPVGWFLLTERAGPEPLLTQAPRPEPRQALTGHEATSLKELRGVAQTLPQINEEELQLARHVPTSFPKDVRAWILLDNVFYQHGDIPQGMELWTQGLSLDANHVKLHLRLGVAAADLGEPERALAYWRRALQISPDSPELRLHMANVLIELGRHKEAVELLEQECKIAPGSMRNFFLLGQTYLQLQDYDRAISKYERTIELNPDCYNAYYGLGNAYLRLKDRDKAQSYMQRFRELKKARDALSQNQVKADEVPDARKRMARRYMEAYNIYRKARRHQAGEVLLERAVRLDPANTSHLERMGAHYYSLRRLTEALRVFEVARKIDPDNLLFYLNISKIYVAQKRLDQAEQILSQTIARFPSHGLAHAEFARFYVQTGRHTPRALELAQKACALAPKNQKYRMLHEKIKQKM